MATATTNPIERWIDLTRRRFSSQPMTSELALRTHVFDEIGVVPVGEPEGYCVPINRMVQAGAWWTIIGSVVSGRTLIARGLAQWLAGTADEDPHMIPVYCRARDLAASRRHPWDHAESELSRLYTRGVAAGLAGRLDSLAREGGVCLIVDETQRLTPRGRSELAELLERWASTYQRCALFLFTSPAGWDGTPARAARLVDSPWHAQGRVRSTMVDTWKPLLDQPKRLGVTTAPRSPRLVDAHRRTRRAILALTRSWGLGERSHPPPWFIDELDRALLVGAWVSVADTPARNSRSTVLSLVLEHLFDRIEDTDIRLAARSAFAEACLELSESEVRSLDEWSEPISRALATSRRWQLVNYDRPVAPIVRALIEQVEILEPTAVGSPSAWRCVHRSLRRQLAAEALAERGTGAIVDFAEEVQRTGRRPDSSTTIALASAASRNPARTLHLLRDVDPRLAVEALVDHVHLGPRFILRFLFGTPFCDEGTHGFGADIWNGETLLRLVAALPELKAVLWKAVVSDLRLDHAAFIYYALRTLDGPDARVRFFAPHGFRRRASLPESHFQRLKPGAFEMGSTLSEIQSYFGRGQDENFSVETIRDREWPRQKVQVECPFFIGRHAVTNGQYRRFDPQHHPGAADDLPATSVSWWRACLFAAWVGARLPTEAEWEYACRAESEGAFFCPDEEIGDHAWFIRNAGGKIKPVAQKKPNPWGLHDMLGSTWEWCQDPWSLPNGSSTSLRAHRVARGGSSTEYEGWIRAACRSYGEPAMKWSQMGFRLAREAG